MEKSRKEQIVQAAAELFQEKGYSAVSMRDIAAKMNIKASSLYNHIKSKQDILTDIIITLAKTFTVGMTAITKSDAGCVEKLKRIIVMHIEVISSNMSQTAALNNDWMHLEEELPYFLKQREAYEDNFKAILICGINKKEIEAQNVEVMVFSILSTLRSLYLWMPKKEDITPADLAIELSEVLIEGIRKK